MEDMVLRLKKRKRADTLNLNQVFEELDSTLSNGGRRLIQKFRTTTRRELKEKPLALTWTPVVKEKAVVSASASTLMQTVEPKIETERAGSSIQNRMETLSEIPAKRQKPAHSLAALMDFMKKD